MSEDRAWEEIVEHGRDIKSKISHMFQQYNELKHKTEEVRQDLLQKFNQLSLMESDLQKHFGLLHQIEKIKREELFKDEQKRRELEKQFESLKDSKESAKKKAEVERLMTKVLNSNSGPTRQASVENIFDNELGFTQSNINCNTMNAPQRVDSSQLTQRVRATQPSHSITNRLNQPTTSAINPAQPARPQFTSDSAGSTLETRQSSSNPAVLRDSNLSRIVLSPRASNTLKRYHRYFPF